MTDRAGFLAGCADTLTSMCVYYAVAGILIMSGRGWGLHLFWLLLCAAVCAGVYSYILRSPRSVPFLTALTGVLFAAVMAVFWLASTTPMKFGYGFVLAIGAGMAAGLPLYYTLKRPLIHQHLAHLDALIIVMIALFLMREALGIDGGTVVMTEIVLLMDAAAAVGLRMSDGGAEDGANAFKASMIALGAAAGLALVIGLMTTIFSRSGAVTGSVLHGVGAFFSAIGRGIERFFIWLTSFIHVQDETAPLELEETPSLAAIEGEAAGGGISADTTAVGIVIAVIIAAAAVAAALIFRKKRLKRGTDATVSASDHSVRRTGGTAGAVWQRILERLRFLLTAFILRDTPGGLLVILERRGKRARRPRGAGESMRHFIARMDESGSLGILADALDREYYGGEKHTLSAQQCRRLRRYIRKAGVR